MVYSSLSCSGDSEGSRGAAAESTWNRRRMTTTASIHHRTQVFSKNASMEFSPPQSAPVTLTALDQTIYHIVYRSSIDFQWSQLSNSPIRIVGGPALSTYENQTCREARLSRCISPPENLEFGKRWFVIGAKTGPPQRGGLPRAEDEHGAYFSNLIPLEKHSGYPARKR